MSNREALTMAINREKSAEVWAVLDKDIYEELRQLADEQERSISKQAAYIIKEYIINNRKKNK
jgi:hypothetical protein